MYTNKRASIGMPFWYKVRALVLGVGQGQLAPATPHRRDIVQSVRFHDTPGHMRVQVDRGKGRVPLGCLSKVEGEDRGVGNAPNMQGYSMNR